MVKSSCYSLRWKCPRNLHMQSWIYVFLSVGC